MSVMSDRMRRHVLVTRSGQEGAELVRLIEARGDLALHLPLVELRGVESADDVRARFRALPALGGVIVTSREGVRQAHVLGLLDAIAAMPETVPLVVPGSGTAALARQLGAPRVLYPSAGVGTSEQLLQLDVLRAVRGQCWLILAAADGRRLLDEELSRRGARIERLVVYQRRRLAPAADALVVLSGWPDCSTLLTSGVALDRLQAELPVDLWQKICQGPMVVPSARLLERARASGVQQLILSEGASDEAMLKALA